MPTRIAEDQLGGPKQLVEIEPDRPTRDQAAFNETNIELAACSTDERAFHPRREQARDKPDDEHRQQGHHIAFPR